MLPGMAGPLLAAGGVNPAAMAQAYFTAMTTQESAPRQSVIRTFLVNGANKGWLAGRDRLVILCQTTQQAAMLNIIEPTKSCTMEGGGFQSQLGVTEIVRFNEPLITPSTKATLDDVSFSAFQNAMDHTAGYRDFLCERAPIAGAPIYNRVVIENNPGASYSGYAQSGSSTLHPAGGGLSDMMHLGAGRGVSTHDTQYSDSSKQDYAYPRTLSTPSTSNFQTHSPDDFATIHHRLALLQTGKFMPAEIWAAFNADVVTLLTDLASPPPLAPTIYDTNGDTSLAGNQVEGFAAAATDLDARLTALGA